MKLLFSSRFKFNQDWAVVILLFVITAGLFWRSYVPGTFLMGWDSVMSEFDLGLAWQRAMGGLWQEFQGVGLQGGHGYVTDLVRLPWLWLLSVFLPVSLIRYVMVYVMWLLGIVGSYVLIKKLVNRSVIGLVGALIYGLHPFTTQTFFVIHDAFGWLFMCLPWSVWLLLLVLERPAKQKWIAWLGLQFLASFIGFIPPAFVGYGMTLAIVGLVSKQWKRGLAALVLMGIANLYWLLPFGYYTVTGSNTYVNSKLNQMTTEHNAFISQSYGRIRDLVLGRGFYYESLDWMGTKTQPILNEWIAWWEQIWSAVGLAALAVLVGLGLIFGKKKYKRGFVATLLVMTMILIFPGIFQYVPLLGQAFRIPFTKISSEYVLLFSVFASLGLDCVCRKYKRVGWAGVGTSVVVVGLISWPLMNGRFFYDKMRVETPREYFLVMDYFKQLDVEKRIAVLPVPTYNGWYIQSWNYTGSGFLFYGVKQPILDRAFDVWSPYNETFYNELSTAFYYCPPEADDEQVEACAENVGQVFDKYQVSLALLDESVILPGQDNQVMRYDLWKKVLAKLDPDVNFKSGFLSVYDVNHSGSVITAPEKYRQIEADTTYGRFDPYFAQEITYVDNLRGSPQAQPNLGGLTFPFSNISKENVTGMVEYGEDGTVKIKAGSIGGGKVTFPELSQGDVWRGRIRATLSGEELQIEMLPFGQLMIGDQHLPLWLDQRLEVIKLPEALESVVVQVADKVKTIERDKPDEIWDVPMTVDQGLSLKVFEGDGEKILISTPSAKLGQLSENRLIQIETKQKICLGYEQKNYKCLNQGSVLVTPQKGVYWFDMLEQTGQLPAVTIHQLIANYEFPKDMWQTAKREFEATEGEVVWEMPTAPREVGSWKLEVRSENCDVLGRGKANKTIFGGSILYESREYGAYCDSWWVNPIGEEGILRLTGENLAGRGIKLAVFSTKENRTNLEQLLPSGGKLDQSYGFLTGLQQGSTINVETKSFGRIEGKNRLDSAQFYPVLLTWIQKIKIGEETVANNNLEIVETKKYGTGIYQVRVSGSGLLVLNQGFDRGWVATTKGEHVRVNGWANGWIIPANSEQRTVNSADYRPPTTVLLFYWPQLLEWAGLAMLPVGWLWLRKNR